MRKQVTIPLEVPYDTLGALTDKTQFVWVVCHGYGQLSSYFIKNFECLDLEKNFIIAPQGLSRFYLREFTGRVGATWMTTHDREMEISNYLKMLSHIYEQETQKATNGFKTILHGFSQGAATISRWAVLSDISFDALNLWGGRFPPDLDDSLVQHRLEGKHFSIYLGDQDKYIDAQQRKEQWAVLQKRGLSPEVYLYEGEHKLYEEPLMRLHKHLATL